MVLLCQCSLISPFYGIKKPCIDTPAIQVKYLASLNIDTSNRFSIKKTYRDSLSFRKFALNTYKLYSGASASVVQIRMYDKKGKFVYGWEQCFGSLDHFDIFKTVPMSSKCTHLPINMELELQNDISLFDITSSGKQDLLSQASNHDYTVIVFWASWAGYFSKSTLREVNNYIKSFNERKILFIKLNIAQ